MPKKHSWLTTRSGVFYVRAPVPKELVAIIGKREVGYSLRTKDKAEADRRLRDEQGKIEAQFDEARAKLAANEMPVVTLPEPRPTLLTSQINHLASQFTQKLIDDDQQFRADVTAKAEADPEGFNDGKYIEHPNTEWYLTFYEELTPTERLLCCYEAHHKRRLLEAERAGALGTLGRWEGIARELLDDQVTTSASQRQLARKLQEIEIEIFKSFVNKDNDRCAEIAARYQAEPELVPTPTMPHAAPAVPANPGPKLSTLIRDFSKACEDEDLAYKTILSNKTDLHEFIAICGDKGIRAYGHADGIKFKSTLQITPRQRQIDLTKGLNIAQSAERAEKEDPARKTIPRLHRDTINDKLGAIRKFFKWADAHHKDVTNPVEGLRIPVAKHAKARQPPKRLPLNDAELTKLFHGPVYTGCASLRKWKKSGTLVLRHSARFWVPLIGLFHGIRLGEIIQLGLADVKEKYGIRYFDISLLIVENDDETEDKSLKTLNSVREIPIHPMLFRLGFDDFLAWRRSTGKPRLFSDYGPSKTDGSWSKTFSGWFRDYRKFVGVERIVGGRNRVNFHSFRHNFEGVLRNASDVKKEFRDALQGHSEHGASRDYGERVGLKNLHEAIKAVAYPNLDLSHLVVDQPATAPPKRTQTDTVALPEPTA